MKTFCIIFLLLFVSYQSGATGYSYNMFVAHKKLQTVKESKKTFAPEMKAKKTEKVAVVSTVETQSITNQLSSEMAKMVTLNERIIAEGPAFLFESEEDEKVTSKSVVSRVAVLFQNVFYNMIGLQAIGKE